MFQFNNEVNWVVPCLDSLLPATSQNKRILLDAVDRLHESNLTSYETALEFAYEAFQRVSNVNHIFLEIKHEPYSRSNHWFVLLLFLLLFMHCAIVNSIKNQHFL